eukprot:5232722-Pleurochrysis_carterae.AAC.1
MVDSKSVGCSVKARVAVRPYDALVAAERILNISKPKSRLDCARCAITVESLREEILHLLKRNVITFLLIAVSFEFGSEREVHNRLPELSLPSSSDDAESVASDTPFVDTNTIECEAELSDYNAASDYSGAGGCDDSGASTTSRGTPSTSEEYGQKRMNSAHILSVVLLLTSV